MKYSTKTTEEKEQTEGKIINVKHLMSYLKRVKDRRKRRGIRYDLEIILVLFILAKLCGQNKVYGIADWLQQRGEYLTKVLGLNRKCLPPIGVS